MRANQLDELHPHGPESGERTPDITAGTPTDVTVDTPADVTGRTVDCTAVDESSGKH